MISPQEKARLEKIKQQREGKTEWLNLMEKYPLSEKKEDIQIWPPNGKVFKYDDFYEINIGEDRIKIIDYGEKKKNHINETLKFRYEARFDFYKNFGEDRLNCAMSIEANTGYDGRLWRGNNLREGEILAYKWYIKYKKIEAALIKRVKEKYPPIEKYPHLHQVK